MLKVHRQAPTYIDHEDHELHGAVQVGKGKCLPLQPWNDSERPGNTKLNKFQQKDQETCCEGVLLPMKA